MPLWLVIIILGATASGWLFFKAKQSEVSATYKKIGGGGAKSVKKAARHVAKQPSGIVDQAPVTSAEELNFSMDMPSNIAREVEEIMKKEGYE